MSKTSFPDSIPSFLGGIGVWTPDYFTEVYSVPAKRAFWYKLVYNFKITSVFKKT